MPLHFPSRAGKWANPMREMIQYVHIMLTHIARRPASTFFPFDVDANDHCETSLEAYRDLAPFLGMLAEALGKTKEDLVWLS